MNHLVYSTGQGRMCPRCNKPSGQCSCKGNNASAFQKGDGNVRVGREVKGRKGKGVTVITGLPLGREELKELAKELKQRCGTGGTVKSAMIEIQGDHRDILVFELKKRGFSAKRAGG
ncbi:MAG: translation initiation factor Sui1 [Fibrobacteria bacterium]|nr:translation initiation factor Sui1 [Fibrobacteria bacterium]